MNIPSASAVLLEQTNQLNSISTSINILSQQIVNIASQENAIIDIPSRVKALVASINVQQEALASQKVLVQQALDELAALL